MTELDPTSHIPETAGDEVTDLPPEQDPNFLGKVAYPQYQCFVLRKKMYRSGDLYLHQAMFDLHTGKQVGTQMQPYHRVRMTADSLVAGNIRRLGRDVYRRWLQDQQAAKG